MKELGVRQPWAWLMVNAHKDIENRTWSTNFRGRVYVHAGLRVETDDFPYLRAVASGLGYVLPDPGRLAKGAIVGEVDIVGCVIDSDSEWFEGPYGFVLANPVAYETPIPCRGILGFFEPVLPVTLPPGDKS